MFQDLNDLILIYYEKSKELKKPDTNNSTKKIYLRSLNTNKKTIRRFKKFHQQRRGLKKGFK